MKILIDILHPAHVHFFKNFVWEMEKRGHEFFIAAREKEMSLELLKAYNFPYQKISVVKSGLGGLARELCLRNMKFEDVSVVGFPVMREKT